MTAWLVETLIAVSVLMAAVLVLRRPMARVFGATWAYALWLVPALRLVLPPLTFLSPALPPVVIIIPTAGGGTALPAAPMGSAEWAPFLLATWAGGAVIFLVLQWLAYRDFVRRLDGSARRARPPFYHGIATFVSDIVDGPLALGLLRRRIVIPADFSRRYNGDERRLAMQHELTHHRRGDIWWNMAAMLVLAANWFNPLAWIAFRAFRTDQELACDAAVAARASADERHDYARALVKSASRPGLIAACSMSHAGELKRRLRMLRSHRVSAMRSAGGFAALGTVAVIGLSLAAATAQPQRRLVYVAAAPAPAAALPAKAVATAAVRLAAATAPRTRPIAAAHAPFAGTAAQGHHAEALAALEQPRFVFAAAEPALAPVERLHFDPIRLAIAEPDTQPVIEIKLAGKVAGGRIVAKVRTLVFQGNPDPETRERVREAIADAIERLQDQDAGADLDRIDQAPGGAYTATIVQDPKREEE